MRKLLKIMAAGLAGLAVPASAEVMQKSDAGFVIRISGEVAASPDEAWNAFVAPANWWNKAHTFSGDAANLTLDSTANGCFCEKLPVPKGAPVGQRAGSVMHMRVLYAEPYRAMRLTGGLGPLQSEAVAGTMTITFKPVDGTGGKATRILWEYVVGGYMRYKAETISAAVDKVLAGQLQSLIKLVGPVTAPVEDVIGPSGTVDEVTSQMPTVSEVDDVSAGESVKAALDKMFKKGSERLPD